MTSSARPLSLGNDLPDPGGRALAPVPALL